MPDLQTSLDLCTFCPRLCSHTCPVSLAESRETVTPQAKMATFAVWQQHRLRQGQGQGQGQGIVQDEPGPPSLPVYACTGCGACTEACKHHVEPGLLLMQGRDLVESAGHGHPALADLPRRQRQSAAQAAAAAQGAVGSERCQKSATLAYFPACLPGRGGAAAGPGEEASAALRVLDRLHQPAVVAQVSLGCGGYPLYAGGFDEPFRLYAEVFAREVEGFGTLLVGCPACAWLMRTQYPAHGVPLRPQVLHVTEFLAPLAEKLPVSRQLESAYYHDPCYLGRHMRLYQEPRQLLQRAVSRTGEFQLHHTEAACSGGGGLLPVTSPGTALQIAAARLDEISGAGAGDRLVVTPCPSCQRQFNQAGQSRGITARGLLEVLDEATRPE